MLAAFRKEAPTPSLLVFIALQLLDVLSTIVGIRLGASEASIFVGRILNYGPMEGLLVSKLMAVLLVAAALKFHRPRLVVFLNYWFAAVVSWNLVMIVITELGAHR
ncbi:MAG TPA: hypothetical protein VLY24_01295 [Bryobacteraceae bacterium]|nr:hypothetical protein [Bryobacteraceae bacterium]